MPAPNNLRALGFALVAGILGVSVGASPAAAIGPGSKVRLVELTLPGVKHPWSRALRRLSWALEQRTNVPIRNPPVRRAPTARDVGRFPLLFSATAGPLPALSAQAAARLRRHLSVGGTWVIDGPPDAGTAFLGAARRLVHQIFPREKLSALPRQSTVFKSFYLLTPLMLGGRGSVQAVVRDKRATVIVTRGLFAAVHGAVAGRAGTYRLRMALNIVLYAICVDYKSDQVHAPAILRRRRWQVK